MKFKLDSQSFILPHSLLAPPSVLCPPLSILSHPYCLHFPSLISFVFLSFCRLSSFLCFLSSFFISQSHKPNSDRQYAKIFLNFLKIYFPKITYLSRSLVRSLDFQISSDGYVELMTRLMHASCQLLNILGFYRLHIAAFPQCLQRVFWLLVEHLQMALMHLTFFFRGSFHISDIYICIPLSKANREKYRPA